MKPLNVKYCRNADAIARAWGMDLYSTVQRNRRVAQLEIVRAATERPDFPQKQKHGWPREAIIGWGAAHVQFADKKKREFTLVEPKPEVPPPAELPAQPNPAEGDLFETLTPEQIAKANQERLERNRRIHLGLFPGEPLKQFQIKELEANNLIPKTATEDIMGESDEFTGGVEAVAAYVQMKFPGVICNKMDISNWRRMKFLPPGCTEQFPPAHQSGRNRKSQIDPWVFKYLKPSAVEQALPGAVDNTDYDRAQKKLNFERALEEYKVWQQGNSEKFILKETATRTGAAIGAVARNVTRDALEKHLGKRFASGLKEIVPDDTSRLKLVEKLRMDCVSTFTEWQARFAARLGELLKRNLQTEKP